MNRSGLEKNTIDAAPRFLPEAAAAFGLYHCSLGLLVCHGISQRWMLYLDYGFCLMWMASVGLFLLERFRSAAVGGRMAAVPAAVGKNTGLWLLVLLMGFFGCSAWLTQRSIAGSFRQNLGCLFDAGVSFFVLFPLGQYWGRKKAETTLRKYLLLITLLFSLILLLGMAVAFGIGGQSALSSYFYFWEQRFFFHAHPNITALTCCLLLLTGVYGFLRGNRGEKILYLSCSAVLFAALLLTDSRGCILATGIGLSVLLAVFVWERLETKKNSVRVALAAMAVLLALLVIFACREGTRHVFAELESKPAVVMAEDGEPAQRPSVSERPMVDQKGSGRIKAWRVAFKALENEPGLWLRGCGPYNIPDMLVSHGVINPKNTHNQLLEILLGYGLMPLLVFLLWLFWLAHKCVKLGWNKASDWALRVLPVSILAMVICNMLEARLLFYRYFTGSMFFLLAGFVSASAPAKAEEVDLNK